ncbi:hypothetical protein [Actinokineospora spheciospongiae]|uniref:hypothetical protein n=1 Tax=Actinokineospora spheciospongiae TaxID=909613 RepID=UPI00068B7D95|nr:hypothetical protein [Actinokineospora spheciospongiae]
MLVVVRSPAALHRLMDVLPVFEGDPRVELVFTVDGGSWFSDRLGSRLRERGAVLLPWGEAVEHPFDLALAASDNGDLHRLAAPLVLFPHGVGYQRFAAHEAGAVSGLRRSTLVRDGRAVPSRIVVGHPGQLDVIRAVEPLLLPRAVVAGDPCFDRIRLSGRLRDRYRAALGATGKRLVVLCSTWGPHSLYGRQPGLPARVVGAVAADLNRVALVLHPNVWAKHGPLQVRAWLRPAIESGLVVVPPEEGWRAALVAADVVVSDHGSLTSYAAGAGVAVVLAEDGGPEVVPGSPIDRLRGRLARLRPDLPVTGQLDSAAPLEAGIADALFAFRGRSMERVRAMVYGELGVRPPRGPARVRPAPVPEVDVPTPTAYSVRSSLGPVEDGRATVELTRFPALTYDEDQPHARHLAADDTEVDPGWAERAAVVWSTARHASTARAGEWAAAAFAGLPALRVAVAALRHGGLLVAVRGGGAVVAAGPADASLVGSAVQCCLARGVALDRLRRLTIVVGSGSTTVRFHAR